MKKINGGSGKDIEVSDDIADSVDPDSMLSEDIPGIEDINNNINKIDTLPEEHIIIVTDFVTTEAECKVAGLLKKISIINNNIEYEFFTIKKHMPFFLKIQKLEIHKIYFVIENKERIFDSNIRIVKKIEFESFGKQIKCHVLA